MPFPLPPPDQPVMWAEKKIFCSHIFERKTKNSRENVTKIISLDVKIKMFGILLTKKIVRSCTSMLNEGFFIPITSARFRPVTLCNSTRFLIILGELSLAVLFLGKHGKP